jgi:hypothetical protein
VPPVELVFVRSSGHGNKDDIMLKNIFVALVATATIGLTTMETAFAQHRGDDRFRHRHHNRGNVVLQFGGFGDGYYGSRFNDRYRYRNGFYGGYRPYRFRDRYAYDDYGDFGPYCGTKRIKVKSWNRAHTRYKIVTRRVRSC